MFKFDCLTTSNYVFSFMVFTFSLCAPDSPLEKKSTKRVMPFDVVIQLYRNAIKLDM